MNEEVKLEGESTRWMDHVRELEEQIEKTAKEAAAKTAERESFERMA